MIGEVAYHVFVVLGISLDICGCIFRGRSLGSVLILMVNCVKRAVGTL